MMETAFSRTRQSLHGLAELMMAGPQYRRSGTIRLGVTSTGFATTKEPDLRLDGLELVADGRRLPLRGTFAELGEAAGVEPGAPRDLYKDGCGLTVSDPLTIDPDAALRITGSFGLGRQALRDFAPRENPVLWPEHFDLGITWDKVSYGISPGDGFLDEPYAYVGPEAVPAAGSFWNAPFGAARPVQELGDAEAIAGFLAEGRRLLG
ncbi:hypothetical protein ACWEBX_19070 [Streptomyces sp. NPDC005070]